LTVHEDRAPHRDVLSLGATVRTQPPADTLATIGRGYSGRVEYGSDLMTIVIGDEIAVRPFQRPKTRKRFAREQTSKQR
jgi:hypothetical protein